jgi:hypothetical protein
MLRSEVLTVGYQWYHEAPHYIHMWLHKEEWTSSKITARLQTHALLFRNCKKSCVSNEMYVSGIVSDDCNPKSTATTLFRAQLLQNNRFIRRLTYTHWLYYSSFNITFRSWQHRLLENCQSHPCDRNLFRCKYLCHSVPSGRCSCFKFHCKVLISESNLPSKKFSCKNSVGLHYICHFCIIISLLFQPESLINASLSLLLVSVKYWVPIPIKQPSVVYEWGNKMTLRDP